MYGRNLATNWRTFWTTIPRLYCPTCKDFKNLGTKEVRVLSGAAVSIVSLTSPHCVRLSVRPSVFGHNRKRFAIRRWKGCVSCRGICRWRNTPAWTYYSGWVSSCNDGPKPLIGNFTQVSWRKALGVFDARLATAPPECGKELWHWRGVVAEAYLDFTTKLPGGELPILTMRAMREDGRAEGSQYPNLFLRYGI